MVTIIIVPLRVVFLVLLKAWALRAPIGMRFLSITCAGLLGACGQISTNITKDSSEAAPISTCLDNAVTTGPCKVEVSGKVVSDSFGDDITSWTNAGAITTIAAPIPNGFYVNQDVNFTDADLIPSNIVNGVNLFGVTGTAAGPHAACTDNALNAGQCSTSTNRYVTATSGNNVTGWSNGTASTTVSSSIPNAYYSSKSCDFTDADLIATNIKSGVNVFGVPGSFTGSFATAMASSALRDPGVKVISNLADLTTTSSQLTLNHENTTYAGAAFPTTGGYNYRDVPDMNQDDEGYYGTTCKYAPRPSVDCGTSQGTIDLRIADCLNLNGVCSDSISTTKAICEAASAVWTTTATWNGATQCNSGQGQWRLVARSGANKEVWQDQRTGLLWSSIVNAAINWCRATGNTQLTPLTFVNSFNNTPGTQITGNGTIGALASDTGSNSETVTITFSDATTFTVAGTGGNGGCQGGSIAGGLTTTAGSTATYSDAGECSFTITQGVVNFAANDKFTLQSVLNATYSCAAGGPLQPESPVSYCAEAAGLNSDAGENWGAGSYFTAKGGLGKNSTPGVRWRAPSLGDYMQANVNGIRFVMPDMGIAGASRPSPDGSVVGSAEWSSSVVSSGRGVAWVFYADIGYVLNVIRDFTYGARCVGR
ncbi:MAG: hypothetical protein IPK04_11025 [Bdellovibrionales bacterium]|nr:hypothetical protein [Bdellovibrionales bacterium]